jgi:hypothetical protein
MDGKAVVALDTDWPPQPVDRQALDEVIGRFGLAIEQQIIAIGPDDEVEQALALRGQQASPDRQRAGDILRDQAVEEAAHVPSREADDGSISKGGGGHALQLGTPV